MTLYHADFVSKIEETFVGQGFTIVKEMRVAGSKVDVALFGNGKSIALEIKTNQDTLRKLPKQLADYSKVFSSAYVVCGSKHLQSVATINPSQCGIIYFEDGDWSVIREARDDPHGTDPIAIFESVRREDARDILALAGVEIPVMPNTLIFKAMREEFAKLPARKVHGWLVQVLVNRR